MKQLAQFFPMVLLAFSLPAFAAKVIITGQPTVLEKNGEIYVVPEDYVAGGDYSYVVLDGNQHVCYQSPQTSLSTLTPRTVNVTVGGKTVSWNCHPYDTSFFEIQP